MAVRSRRPSSDMAKQAMLSCPRLGANSIVPDGCICIWAQEFLPVHRDGQGGDGLEGAQRSKRGVEVVGGYAASLLVGDVQRIQRRVEAEVARSEFAVLRHG